MHTRFLPLALMALACVPALAADEITQHAAHEHGKATLDVAVDGGRLTLGLLTPAINVLGFERAPRTAAEQQAVADAAALLRAHARLFAFPVAARCTAGAITVTPPDWAAAGGHDHKDKHEHEHDHDHEHGGHAHADYAARWTFDCANPAALGALDAPLVDRLQPGTVVTANVVSEELQTRQELQAGAIRIRLR